MPVNEMARHLAYERIKAERQEQADKIRRQRARGRKRVGS